jgi:hypothetical protein
MGVHQSVPRVTLRPSHGREPGLGRMTFKPLFPIVMHPVGGVGIAQGVVEEHKRKMDATH